MNHYGNMIGSLVIGALGAILYFAVNATVEGIEIDTIGVILMVLGALGFLISLMLSMKPTHSERIVSTHDAAGPRTMREENHIR